MTGNFKVSGFGTLSGEVGFSGDNLDFVVRQWDSSAGSYVNLKTYNQTVPGATGVEFLTFNVITYAMLDKNDRIELWVRNNTDGTDITLLRTATLVVELRA